MFSGHKLTIGIFVAVLILFIASVGMYSHNSFILHGLLTGFWEADKKFCEESGLDVFCIYIDSDYNAAGTRACYILASESGSVMLNEPCKISINSSLCLNNFYLTPNKEKYFNVRFSDMTDIEDVFPARQQMKFYPIYNKLVLYKDDTIYAILYKNPLNTEMKKLLDADDADDADDAE